MSERTHGGYGPTKKEWKDDIIPKLIEKAEEDASESLAMLDIESRTYKDADTVYAYKGKQYRFMRLAIRLLFQKIALFMAVERKAGGFRSKRLEALERRVEVLDGIAVSKSLDAEAYDSMAEMAEQLERMEKRLAGVEERGWRYRGYWRQGMEVCRNDAVTHNGSMFICLRDTTEAPDSSSLDWNVIARKGRDGRDAR